MIYPKKNGVMRWMLKSYVYFILKRHFYRIDFNNIEVEQGKSILLVANHFSIWDGLVLYWVARQFSTKKFHVMLFEETAKKEPMLKYGGAFSVSKGSKDMMQSLDYAGQLLADPANLVLIFPQGKLYSNFVNEVHFEKGVIKIMQQAGDKFQLIYAATFIEHLQHKKPTANIYLNNPANCTFENIEALNNSYQQHYDTSRQQQTKIVL